MPRRTALRLGAIACLVGAVVLVLVALRVGSGGEAPAEARVVADPTSFELPDPGLFGGEAVVLGRSDSSTGVRPAELGCRLVDRAGGEQSSAKMSELRVLGDAPVLVDGEELAPLFAVSSYPAGARVECTDAASVEPLAVSVPSTFGGSTTLVRATAAGGAVLMLVVGVGGLVLTHRRGPGRTAPRRR